MQVILVTGAAGNLGNAVAGNFLDKGDIVYGTLLPGEKNPYPDSKNFKAIPVNLMKEEEGEELVSGIISTEGKIDVLVCTVGGFAKGDIENTPFAMIQEQVDLNFKTAYSVVKPCFAIMKEKGRGRIFLVGARPALQPAEGKGMIAYSLAKGMVIQLAELLNKSSRDLDLVCTVIVPSTIDTPQNREAMPKADPSKWAQPADIAEIISFHCSAPAGIIREQVIKVYNLS